MMVLADASGMSKAETERIWLTFAVWLLPACALLPRRHAWWLCRAGSTRAAGQPSVIDGLVTAATRADVPLAGECGRPFGARAWRDRGGPPRFGSPPHHPGGPAGGGGNAGSLTKLAVADGPEVR